jgi:hypothetical protein
MNFLKVIECIHFSNDEKLEKKHNRWQGFDTIFKRIILKNI